MKITRTDPPGINSFPGLITQVVQPHSAELAYISGQVAADADGEIVGKDNHAQQAERIADNIDAILESLGVTHDSIVKEIIYAVHWHPDLLPFVIGPLRRNTSEPPASTLIGVTALFHPDALLEVEIVVAVTPSQVANSQ